MQLMPRTARSVEVQDRLDARQNILGGTRYLRSLLIHGARAVVSRAEGKDDPLSRWIQRIRRERGFNKACVALANKLARTAWAMLVRGETYRAA